MIDPSQIVGIREIADIAGVTRQAVCNWPVRHTDFPKPIRVLASGPLYDLREVASWISRRKENCVKGQIEQKGNPMTLDGIGQEIASMQLLAIEAEQGNVESYPALSELVARLAALHAVVKVMQESTPKGE